jgi:predicted nucleic acid-binding protein
MTSSAPNSPRCLGIGITALADEALALRAADLTAGHRLRGVDAVYVGVARQANCPLVTLDVEQLRRVAGVITAQTPAMALATLPHIPDP